MIVKELKHALRDIPGDARIEGFDPACNGDFMVRLIVYSAKFNRVTLGSDPSEFSVGDTILHVEGGND
jgi:hypothetical protein